jgi:hypothetical protein
MKDLACNRSYRLARSPFVLGGQRKDLAYIRSYRPARSPFALDGQKKDPAYIRYFQPAHSRQARRFVQEASSGRHILQSTQGSQPLKAQRIV